MMMNEAQTQLMNHIASNNVSMPVAPRDLKVYANEIGVKHKEVYSLIRRSPKMGHGLYDLVCLCLVVRQSSVHLRRHKWHHPLPLL